MTLPALIADDLPIPLIQVSPMYEIVWANQSAQEWLEASLRTLSGKSLGDLFSDFGTVIEACERCQNSLAPVSLHDYEIRRSGRAEQTCQITVFETNGNTALMFQIQSQQPSQRRTGGLAISAMGRMLAHEIKNPLAGIQGAAQLLRDDVDTQEGQSLIDLIRSEIDRIRRLADRMEKLGERDPDNTGAVNIHEVLAKARRIVEADEANTIAFVENYDPSLPDVIGDPDTLMQAVLNLIKNACESIQASGNLGEVRLETSFRTGVLRRLKAGEKRRPLPIEIRIVDNGPGISDSIRNRLFEPFITDKPTGQGLGLALVSKVAAAHGGLVELKSHPGRTVFSILLPTSERGQDEI